MYLEIEAEAFLRHMVRTLVGTMVEVAQGKRSTRPTIARLLEGAPREDAGLTAPAHGLFLWDVRYGRPAGGPAECETIEDAPATLTSPEPVRRHHLRSGLLLLRVQARRYPAFRERWAART